ncbi:N-carbamoylsarcosine amidase [Apiospora arundinis]|uniref:N-carbamoylsarcosine amidase n=1 Tax=Apiospora arundinis TaxID=335852 RepID=A0ABR2JQR1_9PEZI
MASALDTHSQAASYQASGFGNRMGWGTRPALLLIDVCKAYWTPGSPLDLSAYPPAKQCPDVIRRLLVAARRAGVPVIWTAVEYSPDLDMADAGLFWKKSKSLRVFNRGLDDQGLGGWVSEDLKPLESGSDGGGGTTRRRGGEMVVKKKYTSAFFGTALASDLQVLGVDTVVLCGVSTSGCVRASALDAMQNGFRPMVVGAACGDRSEEIQNANLFDLHTKYADVVSEEEAIEHLEDGWPRA